MGIRASRSALAVKGAGEEESESIGAMDRGCAQSWTLRRATS
jgi:hypothetical protein